ncbi:methyl methanesulfonate sensitivity 4 isoform X2 [Anticarsia gemmatalis]|uniref:methyl methanesulfonate sensitivity 4 isoform X2 n=1 Tax=Anticarsia gemmatalis TaxID=129554 RepID=UPI003F76617B
MVNDSDAVLSDNSDIDLPAINTQNSNDTVEPQAGPSDGKGIKKTSAAAQREAKKLKLAEEKAAKKTANDMNKIYKPGECMKYMKVEGHPSLWDCWWCADVAREVSAAGASVLGTPSLCHPALVVWTRRLPRTFESENGQVKLSPEVQSCNHALYVTSAEDISEHVSARTLPSHLAEICTLSQCDVTLVIFAPKDYFKSSRRKTSNSNRMAMSEIDLELAITDLLVSTGCDTVRVNTPNELALLIVQFTKAIAEAPYKKAKRACDEQAEFYMRGDSKKCIAVDKDGIAVGKLWQQMIAILPHSSLETSRALCAQYKSPLALFEALQAPDSVKEVADIGVSRAAVPGSKARRVGPEFARKLKILFTASDGNTLVD